MKIDKKHLQVKADHIRESEKPPSMPRLLEMFPPE